MKYKNTGQYNEIPLGQLNATTRTQVRNLVDGASRADKVDEHGAWDFGAEFDNKGRGSALNWDLYGIGRDLHNRRLLIVIQVRQYVKRSRNRFPDIRKSYFLIGRKEDDTVFAHPVESRVVQYAARSGYNVIRRVQEWIFGAEYDKVLRHGDIALVPRRREPEGDRVGEEMLIHPEDGSASHYLQADEIRQNGSLYALNPRLEHKPGVHPDVEAEGWWKVMIGRRAGFHDFAAPTID